MSVQDMTLLASASLRIVKLEFGRNSLWAKHFILYHTVYCIQWPLWKITCARRRAQSDDTLVIPFPDCTIADILFF